jgi:hypothetical protein
LLFFLLLFYAFQSNKIILPRIARLAPQLHATGYETQCDQALQILPEHFYKGSVCFSLKA